MCYSIYVKLKTGKTNLWGQREKYGLPLGGGSTGLYTYNKNEKIKMIYEDIRDMEDI